MPTDEREIISWAVEKLKELIPQIEEDMARAKALCLRPGGPLLKYKMGQVRWPEEVLLCNLAYLRGSVTSIAEALSSNPKLKGTENAEG